jgi:hypothetical protein
MFGSGDVDHTGQTFKMVAAQRGVNDMKCLLPAIDPLLDKGEKHPVLVLPAVEEGAHVTRPVEGAAGESDEISAAVHNLLDGLFEAPVAMPSPVAGFACSCGNLPVG